MAIFLKSLIAEIWPDLDGSRESYAERLVGRAEAIIIQRFPTLEKRTRDGSISASVVAGVVEDMVLGPLIKLAVAVWISSRTQKFRWNGLLMAASGLEISSGLQRMKLFCSLHRSHAGSSALEKLPRQLFRKGAIGGERNSPFPNGFHSPKSGRRP